MELPTFWVTFFLFILSMSYRLVNDTHAIALMQAGMQAN